MSTRVRQATLRDYRALCALFEELDEFHRLKRPDFFRPFEGPARGREVGKCLLAATMDWSRGQGATHVEVAVHAFNRDARRFCERFGFSASIERLVLAA